MKHKEVYILVFILLVSSIKCQHVSIVGSHFIASESSYTAFLHTQDLDEYSILNVTLKSNEHAEQKIIENLFDNGMKQIKFEIPEESHSEYELHVIYKDKSKNTCTKQSVKLVKMSRRPVVLIQLDKAMYQPGDEVKFRVFILSQKMIPLSDYQINIIIHDDKNNIQRIFSEVKTSEFGVYENSLVIPKVSILGNWKFEVEVNGKRRSKHFKVQELNVKSIGVGIDTYKKVPIESEDIFLGFKVKHPYKKYFQGTVILKAVGKYIKEGKTRSISYSEKFHITSFTQTQAINIKNNLSITSLESDTIVNFLVGIKEENKTETTFKKITKVLLVAKKKENNVRVLRNHFFRPGLKFPIKIVIDTLGSINTIDQIQINLKYHFKNGLETEKQYNLAVRTTTISTAFLPPIDCVKVDINIMFNNQIFNDTVMSIVSNSEDEFMQISPVKRGKFFGDSTEVLVQTTSTFEKLYALIISPNGIIYNREFLKARGENSFRFSFNLTESMLPRSNLFVYYIRQHDGIIIHDYIPLSFPNSVDTSLDVIINPTSKYNQEVEMNITAEQDSMIFLSSTDQASIQENEILEEAIADEILGFRHLKFSNSSQYNIHKLGAFVIEPLNSVSCEKSQDLTHGTLTDEAEITKMDIDGEEMNYFPDVWFHESFKSQQMKNSIFSKLTPISLTTWKISAIAVHRTKGLSITQSQREISVYDDIMIDIKAPSDVFVGEIFSIEHDLINLQEYGNLGKVSIKVEDGSIIQPYKVYTNVSFHIGDCLGFKQEHQTKTEQFLISKKGVHNGNPFFVKGTKEGNLKVILNVESQFFNGSAEKVITVRKPQMTTIKKMNTFLISDLFADISRPPRSDKTLIKSYGNLLGPVLKNPERLFETITDTDEYKASKLAASVIAYRFAEQHSSPNDTLMTNLLKKIWLYYQEVVGIIEYITDDETNINLASLLAQILIDTEKIIKVGNDSIRKCLDFIKNHQNSDGNFKPKANDGLRIEIGNETIKVNVIATLAVLAFSKYDNLNGNYHIENAKAINSLKLKKSNFDNNYERAIVAYAFALKGYSSFSKDLLTKITQSLYTSNDEKYFPMNVEIVSYIIRTKVLLNMDAKYEVKWLITKRNMKGGFFSPYDTILGLQALYEYSAHKRFDHLGIKINQNPTSQISNVFDEIHDETSLPNFTLQLTGNGLGYTVIYHESILTNAESNNMNFGMKHRIEDSKENELNLIIQFNLNTETVLAKILMVDVQLPKGYQYVQHKESKNLKKIDLKDNGGRVILYVSELEILKNYDFVIETKRVNHFYNAENCFIKVYDIDRPNLMISTFYKYDFNSKVCKADEKKSKEVHNNRLEQERIKKAKEEAERRKIERIKLEEEKKRIKRENEIRIKEQEERARREAENRRLRRKQKAESYLRAHNEDVAKYCTWWTLGIGCINLFGSIIGYTLYDQHIAFTTILGHIIRRDI